MDQVSAVMCLQDFVELLTEDVRKMSDHEKAEFRRGWIQAYPSPEFRRSFGPQIGSTVTVQLFNGRKIQGVVKMIYETTKGKVFQVSSGNLTVKVEAKQILDWQ